MSHFCVLVVAESDDENEIDHLLEPYYEQHERGSDYVEFIDKHDEYLDEYNSGTADSFVNEDGSFHSFGWSSDKPAGLKKAQVPFKDIYANFEEYVGEYHGHSPEDKHEDRYGHWANPNSKWDWWTVGGRWSGFLRDRSGELRNYLQVKDLDLVSPRQEAAEEANHQYDLMMEGLDGEEFEIWPAVRDRFDDIQEAKEFYHSQPVLQRLRDFDKVRNMLEPVQLLFKDYDRFITQTREEYVKECSLNVLTPFAWLDKDGWIERGEMLMFGQSADTMTSTQWGELIKTKLEDLSPEQWLWVVDCHV
jgi:hypothetical protein